jgi:hypothetical protein
MKNLLTLSLIFIVSLNNIAIMLSISTARCPAAFLVFSEHKENRTVNPETIKYNPPLPPATCGWIPVYPNNCIARYSETRYLCVQVTV